MNYNQWIRQDSQEIVSTNPIRAYKEKETYWVVYSRYLAVCASKDYGIACRIANRYLAFDGSTNIVQVN